MASITTEPRVPARNKDSLKHPSVKLHPELHNCSQWADMTSVFPPSEAVRRFLYKAEDFIAGHVLNRRFEENFMSLV